MVRIGEMELAAGELIAIEGTTRQGHRRRRAADRARDRRGTSPRCSAGRMSCGASGCGRTRTPPRTRPRRGRSEPRGSVSAGPSTCSSARTGASWCGGCSSPPPAGGAPRSKRPPSGGPAPPELESARGEFHEALEQLGELQRADFTAILHEMRGLPVTVRLLDPPLHEFLPLEHFEAEVRRLEAAADDRLTDAREAAEIVRDLQEANPMLGTRGVRLAFLYPQIYEMQVRAVIAAAAEAADGRRYPARRDHDPAGRLRDRAPPAPRARRQRRRGGEAEGRKPRCRTRSGR